MIAAAGIALNSSSVSDSPGFLDGVAGSGNGATSPRSRSEEHIEGGFVGEERAYQPDHSDEGDSNARLTMIRSRGIIACPRT